MDARVRAGQEVGRVRADNTGRSTGAEDQFLQKPGCVERQGRGRKTAAATTAGRARLVAAPIGAVMLRVRCPACAGGLQTTPLTLNSRSARRNSHFALYHDGRSHVQDAAATAGQWRNVPDGKTSSESVH